jgi:transposase-like protein
VDETYVRVGGRWKYLFRPVDKHGQLIDFVLSNRRNTRVAYCFLRKAMKTLSDYPPSSIPTDKLAAYQKAVRHLQKEDHLADYGALKRLILPTRGFQSMETAYATIKGFEVMRMIRRGHAPCDSQDQ